MIGLQVVISTAVDDQVSALIPRYSILKKQGYRVVIVERHLVFYKINEADKTVIIYAIVDGRKEYRNLI
ncbi:MAG: type II toxin-antitoxin system RelE/ParE family toxin [Desulfitobacterium hafniense]|nr:type II toxin-antitoxin system RelE/ParE family toxin [Desulfitobacterium hafniense]